MFAAVIVLTRTGLAEAAEIKVLYAEALRSAMSELIPDFERASGHKVAAAYAVAGAVASRIRGGEPADVAILPKRAFDPLMTEGKIAPGSAKKVAHSVLAIAVPAGASKPDITTVDALKRTLLDAKSITYSDPARGGGIGVEATRVIERLGLTEQLKSKTTVTPAGEFRDILANRQAELAFVFPIVIFGNARIDLVGPIPAELQPTESLTFVAGIGAAAPEPSGAKAFIEYLSSPAAARIFKAKGMEPG